MGEESGRQRRRGEERETPAADEYTSGGVETPAGATSPVFSDKQAAQIIAVATRLQMKDRDQAAEQLLSAAQLESMAAELGVDPRYVQQAIAQVRKDEHILVFGAPLEAVRQLLIRHFANVGWMEYAKPAAGASATEIVPEGADVLTVRWGRSQMRLELRATGSGATEVAWQTQVDQSDRLGLNVIGSVVTVGTAAMMYAISAPLLLAMAIVGVQGAAFVGVNEEMKRRSDRLDEFCRKHLQNLQLLAPAGDTAAPALPAAGPV